MVITCRRSKVSAPRRIAAVGGAVIRVATLASLAAPLMFVHARTAWAQRIDSYLNPAIPGFSVEPGVTVTSRLRPDYDYPGLRLGSFMFHSELIESVGYETNVTATEPAHGSAFLNSAANVQALSDWGQHSLGASVGFSNNNYFDQPRQSYTNWSAAMGGSYDFGVDTAYIAYAHLNLNETPSDLGVPALDSPIAYRVDTARLNYRAVFGKGTVTPGIEITNYNYDNGTVQGQPYNQTYRNRVIFAPSTVVAYEFDSLRTVLGVVRYADAQYTSEQPNSASRDFNDISVLGGVNYDTGGLVRLRLLLGYEARFFASSQYKTIQAPIIEGSAVWTPTGLTTVTGTVARYIEESATEATVGFTESVIALRVDHEYLPNVLLNATVGLTQDVYSQSEGQQSFFTFGGGVTWLINNHMRLTASYNFASRQSPGSSDSSAGVSNTQILGGYYSDNRFILQFRIGL